VVKARNEKAQEAVDALDDDKRRMEVDFTTLVLSFHQVAVHALGGGPEDEDVPINLPAARMQIDMLRLLKEKTEGNLETDEGKLLDNVLYELHMAYVDACKCAE
jgi:hypothetical protein